jgi:hypothetical protein
MTNQIATFSSTNFAIARTSKTGKVSSRGLLGLIIEGTPTERLETGVQLCREAWDNGNMKVLLQELSRVFAGRTWDMSIAFVGMSTANPDKVKMVLLMEALARFHAEAKGVKAKYVSLCNDVVTWSKDEASRKELRRLAFEADKTALL